jgi:alpha-L-arabinofuranosidase
VFGNNINTQNLSAPYDSADHRFQEEFLSRVRPMGITFLRYPGGCNADVFNWKDTIGPTDQRTDIINYHNVSSDDGGASAARQRTRPCLGPPLRIRVRFRT